MSGTNPNISILSSLITQGVNEGIKDLHTSMPGTVISFDAETQLASVQPSIRRIFKTKEEETEILTPSDLPPLINVPVIFPRGGGFSITLPVKKGDECLISFCERSIDNWHELGGVQNPRIKRFHDLSDAVAFIGLSSKVNKTPNYNDSALEIKSDDGNVAIRLLDDGNIEIDASVKVLLTTPDIEASGNILVKGNLDVEGETALSETVTSNGKDISDTHTHIGSPTAPTGPKTDTGIVK